MGHLTLLRSPHVARLLLGTLAGRLPAGMTALVISLALRHAGVGYEWIGICTAAYSIGSAVGGPVLGRLVDRLGQPRILLASAAVAGGGYVLLATAPGSPAIALGGAALAGLAMPPLEPCLRALWPDIVDPRRLDDAYTLDSAGQQLLFIAGPLCVAGLAAAAPGRALWLAAGLGLAGSLVVATARPARRWTAPPRPAASAGLLGPLRCPGLVLLLVGLTGAGWAVGSQNILAVAYAEAHPGALPGGAATLLALAACGGLAGVMVYGAAQARRTDAATRTRLLAALMAACYLPLILLPAPRPMAALMALSGVFLAPLLAASFGLVGELAPAGTATEAFAWLVTLFASGVALGSAATGTLANHSLHAAALCAAGGITAGALVLLAAGGRIQPAHIRRRGRHRRPTPRELRLAARQAARRETRQAA